MDPELEAFIHLLPSLDLSNPQAARKNFADAAALRPAPDTPHLEIEDLIVPADPDVSVRIYRPRQPQGPSSGCTAARGSSVIWTPSTRWPACSQNCPAR